MRYTLLLIIFLATNAFADEQAITATAKRTTLTASQIKEVLKNCDYNQRSMNSCAEYEFVVADLELNRAYNTLKQNLDGRDISKLVLAQIAWINYRDQNCAFESSDVLEVSMWAMVDLTCQKEITIERTKQLNGLVSCTSIHGDCGK